MAENFLYALHAILPILLLIALGYGFRRLGSWDDGFYRQLNGLCFHLFLPIQLFYNVYGIEDLGAVNWRLLGYILVAIFLCAGLGFLFARLFVKTRAQKGVIVQGAFRSNQAILGLPLANALGGEPAMAFAAVASAVCIPLYNVLAVLILIGYSEKTSKRPTAGELLRQVLRNPLIVATLLGFAFLLVRRLLPQVDGVPVFTVRDQLPSVFQALTNLSKVASPVMLFTLGTRLNFGSLHGLLPQLTLGILLRLVITPAVVIGGAILCGPVLGLTTVEMPTLVATFATPVAVSTAVMVQEIGGDEQLANQLVVWTSAASMLTIFVIVCALRTLGWL